MINNSNIWAFSNQELVSFLKQVGQHDAVKVIQKYDLNGETLLAPMKYSEREQRALMECINLIEQNPLLRGENLKTDISDEVSVYHSTKPDKSEERLYDNLLEPKRDPFNSTEDAESVYFTLTKKPGKATRRPSRQYFICKETTSERRESVQLCQLRSNKGRPCQSTASSASYIRPNTVLLPRYEQIIVDRIKEYVSCENVVGNGQEPLYEVLVPSQVVYTEEKNQKEVKRRKIWFVGDFIMNMCCCSCAMKIH